METYPDRVPERANPEGDTHGRWWWVEPSVWTERMLTALEMGVKGGRWFTLMDKVCDRANLLAAFRAVRAKKGAPGTDHQTIAMVEDDLYRIVDDLHRELREGRYRPSAVKRVWIEKPGSREKRPLGIPTGDPPVRFGGRGSR